MENETIFVSIDELRKGKLNEKNESKRLEISENYLKRSRDYYE